jgi:hypothetical protein
MTAPVITIIFSNDISHRISIAPFFHLFTQYFCGLSDKCAGVFVLRALAAGEL